MKVRSKFLLSIGFAVALTLATSACSEKNSAGTQATQNKDIGEVKQMTQKMMTVCVGRFLIDLPEGVELSYRPARIAGVDLVVEEHSPETQLAIEITKRHQELTGQKNEYGHPSLEKEEKVKAVNLDFTVLYSGRSKPDRVIEFGKVVPNTEEGIRVEALGQKQDVLYSFLGKNLSSPKYEGNVRDLVHKLRYLAPGEVPNEPGFCINRGIILDPPVDDVENFTMFASPKGHPDIAIRLDVQSGVVLGPSLLARDAKNDVKLQHPNNVSTLKKGARTINGIAGEEVLDKFKEDSGTTGHAFTWESPGNAKDVTSPIITMELETGLGAPSGKPVNASLTDPAVLELWDKISSSLRLRPTDGSKHSDAGNTPSPSAGTASRLPLGEFASTGAICGQTGYWRCPESDTQGSTRLFQQGSVMPPATIAQELSMFDRLKGVSGVHQTNTVWQLVGYVESPASTGASAAEKGSAADELPHPDLSVTPDAVREIGRAHV